MSDSVTDRLALPLLDPGQAQKEMFHNEALARLDLAVQAHVLGMDATTPPAGPAPGDCWLLGAVPTGAWAGHGHALAGWTGGGWRFVGPREGMTVWVGEAEGFATYAGGAWSSGRVRGRLFVGGVQLVGPRGAAIAAPAGGAIADTEARAAVTAILAALQAHGLIETS